MRGSAERWIRLGALAFVAMVLAPNTTLAGDPPAHTAAMLQAAQDVANLPRFQHGVGAPERDGVTLDGRFEIPTEGNQECPYPPRGELFPAGCSYASRLGEGINEPDSWGCVDSRQPERMNASNAWVSPGQVFITETARTVLSAHEAAMVCNWNHFSDNPALPWSTNTGSDSANELVMEMADEIVDSIQRNGATTEWGCDAVTWTRYLLRVTNALHYTQDAACEHHDQGNMVCSNTNIIPVFSRTPIVDLVQGRACMDFLSDAIQQSVGVEPLYWCDDAVVASSDRSDVLLNTQMQGIALACGVDPTGGTVDLSASTPKLSLACMGLERTMRHHCYLDAPKTIYCSGEADDHAGDTDVEQFCEGEIYSPAGGQDFLAEARDVSVQPFEEAMDRWAQVCKEPDDPCSAYECDSWCRRSVYAPNVAGYCVNDEPDEACVLHECVCGTTNGCGGNGQPCCHTGDRCDAGLSCSAQTGRCTTEDIPSQTGGVAPVLDPECVEIDGEMRGACARTSDNVTLPSPGTLASGLTLNFRLSPTVPVCDSWPNRSVWNPSPCYSSVSEFSLTNECVYRDLQDGSYRTASCSSIFWLDPAEQAVPWSERVTYQSSRYSRHLGAYIADNCNSTYGAFDTYVYGGDARDAQHKWSGRGRRGLLCRATFNGPPPDGLYGPTWIKARGGIGLESNGDYPGSGAVDVYLPVAGDLRELCLEE